MSTTADPAGTNQTDDSSQPLPGATRTTNNQIGEAA